MSGALPTVLLLTQPGLGARTLEDLLDLGFARRCALTVAVPPAGAGLVARLRGRLRGLLSARDRHRHWPLLHPALAFARLRRLAQRHRVALATVADDADVAALVARLQPALVLTVTSRILYSQGTLDGCPGLWLNLHPGLLPRYAGAVPGPYMFLDGEAGFTLHRMRPAIDGGEIVAAERVDAARAADLGALLFDLLAPAMARALDRLFDDWRAGRLVFAPQDAPLSHCSQARLERDRHLAWQLPAATLLRWVAALRPLVLPAVRLDDGRSLPVRRVARLGRRTADALPGQVCASRGRRLDVAVADDTLRIWLAAPAGLPVGSLLPRVDFRGGLQCA
ncbi:formyltransferase family protein [Chitinimonas koreensis]|uniref:formyltransferase family protein n=1 Tax=Chitinimonas koreensis TaxID=356302 RepID=UPI0003FB989C|nr:formyltransferase family protein [Chitinimonas koreensis]QNM97372.1 hypothetical protein H9L41_03380 [Chitinimonas koreensis]